MKTSTLKKPTAITGLGAVSAQGLTLEQSMENMFGTPKAPGPPLDFTSNHPKVFPVFSLFGSVDHQVSKKSCELTLTARMGIAAAAMAMEDAGIHPGELTGKRVGVIMGTTVGCSLNNDPFYIQYKNGDEPKMDPVLRFFSSNPAQAIAREFNFNGPVQTVVNACASGTDAIGIGSAWLETGICDLVIAGGSDELCKVTYNGFTSLMITDINPCTPFDAKRSGLNLGEGAAVLILEPGDSPLKTRVKCRVAGFGSACDAHHLTAPRPDGQGLKTAINQALDNSGLSKEDIGFINAHGTGTKDNDRVEMTLFKEMLPNIPFFSTKGYTGHTLGAAGALEAAFTAHHLITGMIPASLGFSTQDPDTGLSPVSCHQPTRARAAISQSLAFGGNNAVLALTLD